MNQTFRSCPACGATASIGAMACPRCGHQLRSNSTKIVLAVCLAVVGLLFVGFVIFGAYADEIIRKLDGRPPAPPHYGR